MNVNSTIPKALAIFGFLASSPSGATEHSVAIQQATPFTATQGDDSSETMVLDLPVNNPQLARLIVCNVTGTPGHGAMFKWSKDATAANGRSAVVGLNGCTYILEQVQSVLFIGKDEQGQDMEWRGVAIFY